MGHQPVIGTLAPGSDPAGPDRSDGSLRRILECLADAILVVDRSGRIEFANPAAETLFNRSLDSLVGSTFGFPLAAEGAIELDLPGGREAEMRVVEMSWDGRPAWLASLRDLTSRKEAEEAARRLWRERTAREEAEKERVRLQELLARAPAAILTTRGPDHLCVFANPGMQRLAAGRILLDRPLAESLGELAGQGFLEEFDRALRSGAGHRQFEMALTFAGDDGPRAVCLDLTWEPLHGPHGPEGIMCFAHDVTGQVSLRRDLEAALARLRVEEARKDQFMAMLGHELRNPLAGIVGGLAVLDQRPGPEREAWAISLMRRQANLLTSLLDDLFDVSRIVRGQLELRREVVDLRELVEAAVAATEGCYQQREQRLTVDVPPEPLLVDVDPERFEQVVANLLGNASKYSGRNTKVELRARAQGTDAVIDVADEGVGIAPEMLDEIFEPFIQGRGKDGCPLAGGLGLGLTIVKQLIELHGGSVRATSAGEGRGSTFSVRIPVTARPVQPRRDDRYVPAAATAPTVLVVDDNADGAEALTALLNIKGCRAEAAGTGTEALARAQSTRFDVILLDLDLPDMTGYEVATRLRGERHYEGPVIAISGFAHDQARDRSKAAGIDHHLLKPVDVDQLMRLLARL